MKNILFKIEYEGTRFKGWQIQPNVITVEETIRNVLRRICQCDIQIKASSRTDAGVHARGQVATVQVPARIPLNKLLFSVNSLLPDDISVAAAVEVPLDFNVRIQNCGKRYIYRILNASLTSALHHRFFHWVRAPLDIAQMRLAASHFEGTHDFSAFRGKGCQQGNVTKTIHSLSIRQTDLGRGSTVDITVEGDGFLKNMVRIMVGTLIDVGRGRKETGAVPHAMASGKREEAGLTAPAKGLILDRVFFNPDPFTEFRK